MGELLNNKKPLMIASASVLGILIVAFAVALILRGRGEARFSKTDVPYPYAWEEKRNGALKLTLERGTAAGGVWSLGSAEGDATEIAVGKPGKTTAVTLTPVEEGRQTVVFTLMSGEERLGELSLVVVVERMNDMLAATVTSHSERALQGTVRGGEETGHPFVVSGGDEGLTIFVEDSGSYTEDDGWVWESDSTDSLVAYVSSVDVTDGGVTIRLQTRANGAAEVRVYSVKHNISFVFDVEVADGEMLLTDSRSEPYETAEEPAEAGSEEAQTAETESEAAS